MTYHVLRQIIVVLCVAVGATLHYQLGLGFGAIACYAAALLLTLTHFAFGTVWQSYRALRRGKPAEAERLLAATRFPNLLLRSPRAYYHLTAGMLDLQQKALADARAHLETAHELGLRDDTDRALVALNLGHIAYVQQHPADARRWLERARAHPTRDLMLRDHIRNLERALG